MQHGSPYVPTYPGGGGPPAVTESKATASLILGILSIFCFGILSGIPAIALGFLSRRDIARSGHALGGGGMAIGGIITGAIGSLMSLLTVVFMVWGLAEARRAAGAPFTPAAPPVHAPPAHGPPPPPHVVGAIEVVDIVNGGGPLDAQIIAERGRAATAKRTLIVETTAAGASPCAEFTAALPDPRMQKALAGVTIARVDIAEFTGELTDLGMYSGLVPFFFKVDATAHPTDSLSGDEWDANTPANMAPVLDAYVHGALKKRRAPAGAGTDL